MIFVILCIAIALGILQLGRSLGRRETEQEFQFMRWEMELDDDRKEGINENTSGDTQD